MRKLFALILAVCTLASFDARAWPIRGYAGNNLKTQVNLWFPFENLDFPFINMYRMISVLWSAPFGTTDDVVALINADGYPTALPSGGTRLRTFSYGYYVPGESWVLTWAGTATLSVSNGTTGFTLGSCTTTTNRIVCPIAPSPSNGLPAGTPFTVNIDVTAFGSGVSDIKFFRASRETLLNAGEIFEPDFVDLYKQFGYVRFMDWMTTNASPIVTWEQRAKVTDASWVGVQPKDYVGTCVQNGNDYTASTPISGNPSAWTHGMRVQCQFMGAPTITTLTSMVSSGSLTIVNAPSHGLSTGDWVQPVFPSGQTADSGAPGTFHGNLMGQQFQITVTDANTFTIPVNSSTYTAWSGGTGEIYKRIRFAAGDLPLKRAVGVNLLNSYASFWNGNVSTQNGRTFSLPGVRVMNLVYNAEIDALVASEASSGYRTAMPIEVLVALANKAKVNMWVTIPHGADDTWVTNTATYIRDNLNPSLKVTFEYSNEIWNLGFAQTRYASVMAMAKGWGLYGGDRMNTYYGYRFYQTMGLVSTVFAGQMSRVSRTMAVFTGAITTGTTTPRFQAPAAGLPAYPISRADTIALAPYLESDRATTSQAQYIWQYKQGGSLADDAMTWLDGYLRNDGFGGGFTINNLTNTYFPWWKALADAPAPGVGPIGLVWYEGGWGYIPNINPMSASSYNGNALLADDINISGAANNGSGAIRLTVSTSNLVSGQSYYVTEVYGTTEANGYWQMTVIDSAHVDLVGSTFTNNYIVGGKIKGDRQRFYEGYYQTSLFASTLGAAYAAFKANGGSIPSQYALIAGWAGGGMWGMISPNRTAPTATVPALDTLKNFNWLLKRDLDPASNDNSPMWLEKAG